MKQWMVWLVVAYAVFVFLIISAHGSTRITFYGGGPERTCQGGLAIEGVTVAAHPKYPLGTKVEIPELEPYFDDDEFTVQDRGPAVTKRKASRGKRDVIDVYVRSEKKRRWMARSLPENMKVITKK